MGLTMFRRAVYLILFPLVLAACRPAWAQVATVEYAKVFSVRALSGGVHDHMGEPVGRAKVEDMTDGWKSTLQVVFADEKGLFQIPVRSRPKLHYLRFSAPGFNPVVIKVRMTHWARDRSLSMPVAT